MIQPLCQFCGAQKELLTVARGTGRHREEIAYCKRRVCRTAAVNWKIAEPQQSSWLIRYGSWIALGLVFLVWELLGVKRIRALLASAGVPTPAWMEHPSLSAIEWKLPLPGRLAVDAFLIGLIVHFTFQTSLIPGVG